MRRQQAIDTLRRHEAELRDMGIVALSLFGSAARDEAGERSDVDLAARFAPDFDLFRYGAVIERLKALLDHPVDLVSEPALRPSMRHDVDRDRVHVF